MQLYFSARFIKSFRKLPDKIKSLAEKKEKIFIKNPFDRRLGTHKLHDEFDGFLSFSVNRSYRIIFDFLDGDIVRFYDIGTHDIYK